MYNRLLSLAGDLVFERRQISSGLRKLEGMLLSHELTRQIYESMGIERADELYKEVDSLAQRLDRIGALVEGMARFVNQERLTTMDTLVDSCGSFIDELSKKYEKPIALKLQRSEAYVEDSLLSSFETALYSILDSTFEFGIEQQNERLARQKSEKCRSILDLKSVEEGYKLTFYYEGNGVQPPLKQGVDMALAKAGVRYAFEGKPGHYSAWIFYLPSNFGAYRCVRVSFGDQKVYIPRFYVSSAHPQPKSKIWNLGNSFSRFPTETPQADSECVLLKVSVGISSAIYSFDEVNNEPLDCFVKPLTDELNVYGRFLGVVAAENQELNLVINPAYLVYGDLIK